MRTILKVYEKREIYTYWVLYPTLICGMSYIIFWCRLFLLYSWLLSRSCCLRAAQNNPVFSIICSTFIQCITISLPLTHHLVSRWQQQSHHTFEPYLHVILDLNSRNITDTTSVIYQHDSPKFYDLFKTKRTLSYRSSAGIPTNLRAILHYSWFPWIEWPFTFETIKHLPTIQYLSGPSPPAISHDYSEDLSRTASLRTTCHWNQFQFEKCLRIIPESQFSTRFGKFKRAVICS